MPTFVYIILCSNGKFYTGFTRDLKRRLDQHWSGQGAKFTIKHPPQKVVRVECFNNIQDALAREKQIKRWSHAKKQALIDGDFELLRQLS